MDTRVSTADVFPTILEIAGVPAPEGIDSVSLMPLLTNQGEYSNEFVFAELFGREGIEEALWQKSVSDQNWKLIDVDPESDLPTSLFNLNRDPNKQDNLYGAGFDKEQILRKELE